MRLGVIDVGSNTVHLLVVDAHPGASPVPYHSQRSTLRLMRYLDEQGCITEEGQQAMANTHRLSLIEGIVDPETRIPEGTVITTIDYDPFWSGANRARLLERYKSEIRRGAEG